VDWNQAYNNSTGIQFYRKAIESLPEKENDIYSKGFNCEYSGKS